MSSKSFALASFIPRITSITKTDAPSRRATSGRPAARATTATRTASLSRATSGRSRMQSNSWMSLVSAGGVAAIVVAMGFYVYNVNASASKGYEFKQQQAAVDALNETQKRLVVQQAALGSIVKVNDVASTAGMVPVTGEEFLVANQLSAR